ncbi:MAG: OmpA family protein [Treponema sp.]|nr:OmpA family protein [Treponema sp.]
MIKLFLRIFTAGIILTLSTLPANAQSNEHRTMTSSSRVNWITRQFISSVSLDSKKAGIELPSGRNTAAVRMHMKLPLLIKDPLLSLCIDNSRQLGDFIRDNTLTFEQITDIIESGSMTPDVFAEDGSTLSTVNTVNMNKIGRLFIKQKYPYTPEPPIDSIASRPYTGIIIDARGSLPVQGEYITSSVSPCFFPKIWNEDMDQVYTRDMMENDEAKKHGIVLYGYYDDETKYAERTGTDPLYIRAYKVYGRNRTDPVIHTDDSLRILTVPQNVALLKKGNVVILLNKDELIHDVAVPQKDDTYYTAYSTIKQYFYENKVPGITVEDSTAGIQFSVDLKFKPDSAQLLPSEQPRINVIAEKLSKLIKDNEFTILVEGYTADIGRPAGQMNLSIERTRTVMNALISAGIPKDLFTYKGYGGANPIGSNETEEGRRLNRRVDITARPKSTYIQRDW